MNTEYVKELLKQAKQEATTEEAKSLVSDLESLIDMIESQKEGKNGTDFLQNMQKMSEKLADALQKTASGLGINTEAMDSYLSNAGNFAPEQWEKMQAVKEELQEKSSAPTLRLRTDKTRI